MPAKKKQSKLSKLVSSLNPTTPLKKFVLFIIVFALVGGGYYLYKSYAFVSTPPPSNMAGHKSLGNVKASDGVISNIICNNVAGITSSGKLASCLQLKPGLAGTSTTYYWRAGFYNLTTKIFTPNTSWLKEASSGYLFQCQNIDSQFRGVYAVATANGPLMYGQVYHYLSLGTVQRYEGGRYVTYPTGKWQIKWATKTPPSGSCVTSGVWMDASPW